MKTLSVALILVILLFAGMLHNVNARLHTMQAHYQATSDSLAVAEAAVQIFRWQEAEHELPKRSEDINLPPWLAKEFSIQDAAGSGIRARQSAAFRGTGFNLYCERSATGDVVVFYETTSPPPAYSGGNRF